MLTLIKSSFIDYKLTILRNKKTRNSLFRQTMNEISYLIAGEVLKFYKYNKITIETPITKARGVNISEKIIILKSYKLTPNTPFSSTPFNWR